MAKVINLWGKEYITHEWLLDLFHTNGWKSIHTNIVNMNPFIVQATAEWEKWIYQWIGDADKQNVDKKIEMHFMRMAETRAINRALRLYNNHWWCSFEELAEEVEWVIKKQKTWIEEARKVSKEWFNNVKDTFNKMGDDKQRFNDPEYKALENAFNEWLYNWVNSSEMIKNLRKSYKVSKKMQDKIKLLFDK